MGDFTVSSSLGNDSYKVQLINVNNGPVVDNEIVQEPVAEQQQPVEDGKVVSEPREHAAFVKDLFESVVVRNKDKIVITKGELSSARSAAKGAGKLSKEAVAAFKAAETARVTAQRAMADLDKLTGRQLADAAVGKDPDAMKTLQDAIESQLALADALDACNEHVHRPELDELSMRANLRAAELSRLACGLAEVAEVADNFEEAFGPQLAQDKRLTDKGQSANLARIAAEASGNRHALEFIEEKCRSPLAVMRSFAKSDKPLTPSQIQDVRGSLVELEEKVGEAIAGGIDFGGEGKGRTMVDPAVFRALKEEIASAREKLKAVDMGTAKAGLAKMLMGMKLPTVKQLDAGGYEKDRVAKIGNVLTEMQKKLVEAAKAVESPNPAMALDDILTKLSWIDDDEPFTRTGSLSPEEFDALAKVKQKVKHLKRSVEHVIRLADNAVKNVTANEGASSRMGDLVKLMSGKVSLAALAEANVLGLNADMLDTEVAGLKPSKVEDLGNGAFSAPKLCTFRLPDGSTTQRVFKPELPALPAMLVGVLSVHSKFDNGQISISSSRASYTSASLLGCGELVAKTTLGHLNGEFGMFMEVAPGITPRQLALASRQAPGQTDEQTANEVSKVLVKVGTTPEDYRKYGKEFSAVVKGNAKRMANRLQWLDLINGQLDRHDGNYCLHLSKTGEVTLKGIDNDQSFPTNIKNVGRLTLTNHETNKFRKRLVENCRENKVDLKSFLTKMLDEKAIDIKREDGEIKEVKILDYRKLPPLAKWSLNETTGLNSIAIPTRMDAEFFESVKRIHDDPSEYRRRLKADGLTDEQVDAAVSRLGDVYKIGVELSKKDDGLIDKDSWHLYADDVKNAGGHKKAKAFPDNYFDRRPFEFIFQNLANGQLG